MKSHWSAFDGVGVHEMFSPWTAVPVALVEAFLLAVCVVACGVRFLAGRVVRGDTNSAQLPALGGRVVP